MDEIATCFVDGMRNEEVNEKTKPYSPFLKYGVDVVNDVVNERLCDRFCAHYLRSIRLPVLRSRFVDGGYTLCLKDCIKERNFTGD